MVRILETDNELLTRLDDALVNSKGLDHCKRLLNLLGPYDIALCTAILTYGTYTNLQLVNLWDESSVNHVSGPRCRCSYKSLNITLLYVDLIVPCTNLLVVYRATLILGRTCSRCRHIEHNLDVGAVVIALHNLGVLDNRSLWLLVEACRHECELTEVNLEVSVSVLYRETDATYYVTRSKTGLRSLDCDVVPLTGLDVAGNRNIYEVVLLTILSNHELKVCGTRCLRLDCETELVICISNVPLCSEQTYVRTYSSTVYLQA